MKSKIILIVLFFLSFQFLHSEEVITRYYNSGQTKAAVQKMFNYVQDGYRNKDYKLHFLQRKSADSYVINYETTNGEVTNNTIVKYEFFNDRVTITMIYCAYKRGEAKPIVIGPDYGNESQKKLYYAMRRAFVDSIFEYLEITENTEPLNKAG